MTGKTIIPILAALASVFACNPQQEIESVTTPDQEVHTFTCVIAQEAPDSKVSISEKGKTRWEPGDQILVHGQYTTSGKYAVVTLKESDISSDGKSAVITFSGVTPYDRTDKGYTSSLYAGYPASAVVREEKCYYYTNFSTTTEPMMAAYDHNGQFVFYNLCGVLSFRVSGDFDEVELSGNDGETVGYDYLRSYLIMENTGEARLDYSYVNNTDGGTYGPLTSVSGPVVADGTTVNNIGIPLGVDFKEGFTLTFKKNGVAVKVCSSTKGIEIPRGKILVLKDITSRLQDTSDPGHQSTIDFSDAIDLGASGTANCYVVEDAGTYKFKAVQGNSTKSVGTLASVELVWETCGNGSSVTKNSVIKNVDFSGNWIGFETSDNRKPGNALIAAKDANGKILWSWHIWIPETTIEENTYNLSSHAMMDRNLGALEATKASGKVAPESYGLLYQWGRKDPFPGAKEYNSSTPASVAGTAKTVSSGPISLAESIANPTLFANPAASETDWCSDTNAEYWGQTAKSKTIYDPCPPGYRVLYRDEASAFYNTDLTGMPNFKYDSTNGWLTVGDPAAVFPLAGYIETSGGMAHAYDRLLVWNSRSDSSNPYAGYGQYVYNDSGTLKSRTYSQSKARAASIRCFNEDEIPFENAPGMPVQGSYTRTVFDSTIKELSGLCFSKDKDFIWGVGDEGDIFKITLDMQISIYKSTGSDLEDVTLDPNTGDLYFAKEPDRVDKMAAPGYSSKTTAFYIEDAKEFDNSGLEGIAWYKDNTLYVGAQTSATLWKCSLDGTVIWKKLLGSIAPGIKEVGGLCYDIPNDWLWVTDSETHKLYVFNGEVTKLLAIYDVSDVGNAESVLVDHARNCVYVGDDGSSSKIYKYSFTGLNNNSSGGGSGSEPVENHCKDEYLGERPMVIAYLTEYTSTSTLDATYLTHINYAHGRFVNPSTGAGGIRVEEGDGLLSKVLALKTKMPSLKVLLMIGGWGAKANGFSMMARDATKRAEFCQSCKTIIDTYGFDGIDLDWEYPTYAAEGNDADPSDTQNFNLVLAELRQAIGDTKIISMASADNAEYVNWAGAMEYLDYVNVMTYSMGDPPYHNSPLYHSSITRKRSCEESIELHRKAGIPLNKQCLGVPFYGHAIDPYKSEVKFYEMDSILNNHYYEKGKTDVTGKNIRVWDDVAKVPYITDTDGNMLICYDDEESVACKGAFARSKGMLGVMVWEYRCDDDNHTLMRTLYNSFRQ